MKKILITGKNSYIGTSFEKWLVKSAEQYQVDTIDMKDANWREKDFSQYDVVFHVAAIVHVKERDIKNYFKVNRDLAIEVAQKAKASGVNQFIFLSTMGVYGKTRGYIDANTKPNPKTAYAKSKLEAEALLNALSDESFVVSILRPPLVYGRGCRGNYSKLSKIVVKLRIFPNYDNKRSMIFVDNLSEFVRLVIDQKLAGLFFPQNDAYVNVTRLMKTIAEFNGKKLKTTSIFNPLISLAIKISETFSKVFGTFIYDMNLKGGPLQFDYMTCTFTESIERTECI